MKKSFHMNKYVADTMALVLWLEKRKMGAKAKIISAASQISDIPELHDRLIAATARNQLCSLLTNDPVIQAFSFLSTIW